MSGAGEITFAIPFYSGIEYLPRAIASVLAQRDGNWRAYVVDNASSEPGVEEIVRRAGGTRVGYVRNLTNLGMAGNFNRCIELATTDLVTLLHADDELGPGYTGAMRAAAGRHPNAAALFCRAEIIGPTSEYRFSLPDAIKDLIHPSPRREHVLAGADGILALLAGNFIFAPTLCFRKSVLGDRRFPNDYKFVLDQELTTAIMLDGDSLVGVPDRCYRYRRHDNNATEALTRTQERFREESAFYDRMRAIAHERGWPRVARRASAKRMLKLNLAYRALKSFLHLDLRGGQRELAMLYDLLPAG